MRAKLTDREVQLVRALFETGQRTRKELAYEFGVSYVLICKIVSGEMRKSAII
jgi:hypothetical protein